MKLRDLVSTFAPWAWAVIAAVALVIVLLVGWFVTESGRARQRAAEAEVSAKLSDARTQSAGDAVTIQDGANAAATASDKLSRESADAIRNTPGADQRLDPRLNDTGRRRMCKRAAYRCSDECVQLVGRPEPAC